MNTTVYEAQKLPEYLFAKRRALIVEDDPFSRHLFGKILADNFSQIEIFYCRSYDAAMANLNSHDPFNLVILDIYLGSEKNGIDLYLSLLKHDPKPIVVMTSALAHEEFVKLFPKGVPVPPYLKKPFHIEACVSLIEALAEEEGLL